MRPGLAFSGLLLIGMIVAASPVEGAGAFVTDEADSLYTVAGDLYVRGEYQQSIPLFLRVVELEPEHGNAHALLGGAYLHLGDYPNAIGAFERALELDEGIRLAYLGLVAANYFTERIEAAESWVLKLIPILNGEERTRYLARLSAQFPEINLPEI